MYHSLSSGATNTSFPSSSSYASDPFFPSAAAFLDAHGAAFLPAGLSSSLPSPSYLLLSRSDSSNSLPLLHAHYNHYAPLPAPAHLPSSPSSASLPDFASSPVRRVFSTGDLEEQSYGAVAQEGGGGGGNGSGGARVGRYSSEERRERIEKYRSKRNQRNFQKKITYACRKTLADSRPRVKGRFARNGESEAEAEAEAEAAAAAATTNSAGYGVLNFLSAVGGNGSTVDDVNSGGGAGTSEWWAAVQEALESEEAEAWVGGDMSVCDEELLAAYLGVSSMNLYSCIDQCQ